MTADSAVGLAEFVRTRRLRAGLTQEDLAERSGLTVDTIGALERGLRRRLYPHTAAAIAEALALATPERADLADLARGPSRQSASATVAVQQRQGTASVPATSAPLHNLPARLTTFLGREKELAEVQHRIANARLLTLTGPGGIGKTRLAVEVAELLRPHFPDGVWFVELAPVTTADLVLTAIAEVLRVRQESGQSLRTALIESLQSKNLLLVLDNCEQALDCARDVAALLAACPGLRVLATSRSPLHISGEHEMAVPPLSAPRGKQRDTFEAVSAAPSVRLFTERATAVKADFTLTPENATAVAEICSRLDGLPLALELAAARIKLFTPNALLLRLDHSLGLLTGGPLDRPERQRTLRAAIEWSYDLLAPPEQAFFRHLGVFVGGFTLAAAEACCPPDLASSLNVLDALTALVDKSLLQQDDARPISLDRPEVRHDDTPSPGALAFGDQDDGPRFVMLETIHTFALEQLTARDEQERAAERHLAWSQELMDQAAADLQETAPVANLFRARALLQPEQPNLRSALNWAVTTRRSAAALRLAASLCSLWVPAGNLRVSRRWFEHSSGTLAEARRWLEEALALPHTESQVLRANALYSLGRVLLFQWEDPTAERGYAIRVFEESSLIYRQVNDKAGLARGLIDLGFAQFDQSNHAHAADAFTESLALSRQLGSRTGSGWSLVGLGRIAQSDGDHGHAADLFESAYDDHRSVMNLLGMAASRDGLGLARQAQRDYAAALLCFEEAVEIRRGIGAQSGIATALQRLAVLLGSGGQPQRALALAHESLVLAQRMANPWDITNGLLILGAMAGVMDSPALGARLFAAGETFRERKGLVAPADYTSIYDRSVAAVRRRLGEEAFAAEWAVGASLTVDEAIAEALDISARPADPPA